VIDHSQFVSQCHISHSTVTCLLADASISRRPYVFQGNVWWKELLLQDQ
jgi:hypothetical protein